jgi:hypothetical protein
MKERQSGIDAQVRFVINVDSALGGFAFQTFVIATLFVSFREKLLQTTGAPVEERSFALRYRYCLSCRYLLHCCRCLQPLRSLNGWRAEWHP